MGEPIAKKFVFVEKDDEWEILVSADTKEEFLERLWKFLTKGYCDTFIMTREQYLKEKFR